MGLLSALMAAGRLPERSERGETLDEALKTAKGCCAVFPEVRRRFVKGSSLALTLD